MANRRFVLAARPDTLPRLGDFTLEDAEIPAMAPGRLLIQNRLVGLSPGLRLRLSGERTFTDPIDIGAVVESTAVGTIAQSDHPDFQAGDWVVGNFGWQEWVLSDGKGVSRMPPHWPRTAPLSILGSAGLTAYFGLLELGAPKPGETVLVSSAAGSVGSIAGQIAKRLGTRVIGIAGGAEKCRWLTEELGFDAAIDRKHTPDLGLALTRVCPQEVDILLDSVGNQVIDATLPHMRPHGRIVAIGQIGDYNTDPAHRHGLVNTQYITTSRLTVRGLGVYDFVPRFPEARERLEHWLDEGALKWRDDIVDGLENLPQAFISLFTGGTFGRKIVRLSPES